MPQFPVQVSEIDKPGDKLKLTFYSFFFVFFNVACVSMTITCLIWLRNLRRPFCPPAINSIFHWVGKVILRDKVGICIDMRVTSVRNTKNKLPEAKLR